MLLMSLATNSLSPYRPMAFNRIYLSGIFLGCKSLILSRPDLIKFIDEKKLKFDPKVSNDDIAQVSVDLRLGRKFSKFKETAPKHIAAINVTDSLWAAKELWEDLEVGSYFLRPGEFVLAETLETVTIPNDLVGLVEGRSSWARVGIMLHLTAPKIDPGFIGVIALEMYNFGKYTVELRAEIDKPAQLILARITSSLPNGDLYGAKNNDIFQYQTEPIPHKKPLS